MTDDQWIAELIQSLGRGNWHPSGTSIEDQAHGIDALLKEGEASVPFLLNALFNENEKIRFGAIDALAWSHLDSVLGAIIYVLQNDVDSRIRAKAARSLLFVRDERVIPALIEAIHDRDWDVRNSSRSTLRTIGSSAFEAVFIALRDSIQPLQLGPFSQAVPGTSELIHLLGDFEDERAVDLLVSYVASPNVSLKERAIASLGRIGSERATEPLIELTRDTDSNIRREAVCALCELGDERARERVISIVRDP